MFLSHTSELRQFPAQQSFVAAAESAVIRAQCLVTDMAYFAARDQQPADRCREILEQADVYIGIIGFRYGSLVRDRADLSYTELEFDTATALQLPRLIFLLDEHQQIPLPAEQILDLVHGGRQAAFRRRLLEQAGMTVIRVASPLELEARLYQALVELAPPSAGPDASRRSQVVGASVAVPVGQLPVEVRGRDDLLASLRDERGVIVLAGMGGVGKSTVAAEVARLVQPERWVWWVSAVDASSLAAGMVTVARLLGAGVSDLQALAAQARDAPDRLWALLDRTPDGWLLVIDNADEPVLLSSEAGSVASGTGWVRHSRRGLVLVTSRQADQQTWGRQARIVRLAPLTDHSAAEVLLDLAPHAGGRDQAAGLARRLGGLPLALHLAGSYLSSGVTRWSSFSGYQRALDQDPASARLLRPDPDSHRADDPRASIMDTWELSLDDLANHRLPHARPLLRLLSCFAAAVPIPLDLLDPARMHRLLFPIPDDAHAGAATRLEQGLRGLGRVGLVDVITGRHAVIVHPVIAASSQAHLLLPGGAEPSPDVVRQIAIQLVTAAVGTLNDAHPPDWPRLRRLTPHLLALLDTVAAHTEDAGLAALIDAVHRVVVAEHWSGAMAAARHLTRKALAVAGRLGEDHPGILDLRHLLAYQTGQQGRWAEAEDVYRAVADAKSAVLGPDDLRTLVTRNDIARTIAMQGRWQEAEAEYREVLSALRRVLGEESPFTLTTRHELAWTIASQGRWTEAEAGFREVLDVRQRLLGYDYPSTLVTRHELARTLAGQARWQEAEDQLREVLRTQGLILGDDHPDTLSTLYELANALVGQDRLEEAGSLFRETLAARRRVLGEEHPDTTAARRALEALDADPPSG